MATTKPPFDAGRIVVLVLLLAGVAVSIVGLPGNEERANAARQQAQQDRYLAACREAVSRSLHDPSSAQWGDAKVVGPIVEYELRAKNLMGAYRLSTVRCEVDRNTMIATYTIK